MCQLVSARIYVLSAGLSYYTVLLGGSCTILFAYSMFTYFFPRNCECTLVQMTFAVNVHCESNSVGCIYTFLSSPQLRSIINFLHFVGCSLLIILCFSLSLLLYSYAPDQPYNVTELQLSQCRPCDQL